MFIHRKKKMVSHSKQNFKSRKKWKIINYTSETYFMQICSDFYDETLFYICV